MEKSLRETITLLFKIRLTISGGSKGHSGTQDGGGLYHNRTVPDQIPHLWEPPRRNAGGMADTECTSSLSTPGLALTLPVRGKMRNALKSLLLFG